MQHHGTFRHHPIATSSPAKKQPSNGVTITITITIADAFDIESLFATLCFGVCYTLHCGARPAGQRGSSKSTSTIDHESNLSSRSRSQSQTSPVDDDLLIQLSSHKKTPMQDRRQHKITAFNRTATFDDDSNSHHTQTSPVDDDLLADAEDKMPP